MAAAAFVLPYTPIAGLLGFEPLPAWVLLMIGGIVAVYTCAAEFAKKLFYKKMGQ